MSDAVIKKNQHNYYKVSLLFFLRQIRSVRVKVSSLFEDMQMQRVCLPGRHPFTYTSLLFRGSIIMLRAFAKTKDTYTN